MNIVETKSLFTPFMSLPVFTTAAFHSRFADAMA
jgi:hypothetical protein